MDLLSVTELSIRGGLFAVVGAWPRSPQRRQPFPFTLVLHPHDPRVTGIHINCHYFEVLDVPLPVLTRRKHVTTILAQNQLAWFDITTDLTPFYVNEDCFRHPHVAQTPSQCDMGRHQSHQQLPPLTFQDNLL